MLYKRNCGSTCSLMLIGFCTPGKRILVVHTIFPFLFRINAVWSRLKCQPYFCPPLVLILAKTAGLSVIVGRRSPVQGYNFKIFRVPAKEWNRSDPSRYIPTHVKKVRFIVTNEDRSIMAVRLQLVTIVASVKLERNVPQCKGNENATSVQDKTERELFHEHYCVFEVHFCTEPTPIFCVDVDGWSAHLTCVFWDSMHSVRRSSFRPTTSQ